MVDHSTFRATFIRGMVDHSTEFAGTDTQTTFPAPSRRNEPPNVGKGMTPPDTWGGPSRTPTHSISEVSTQMHIPSIAASAAAALSLLPGATGHVHHVPTPAQPASVSAGAATDCRDGRWIGPDGISIEGPTALTPVTAAPSTSGTTARAGTFGRPTRRPALTTTAAPATPSGTPTRRPSRSAELSSRGASARAVERRGSERPRG
jgi:hypothetical protein